MGAVNPEWTEPRLHRLRKLWNDGWTARSIAKTLGGGLTKNAVLGKVHRLRLGRHKGPGLERAIIPPKGSGAPRHRMSAEERAARARDRMRRLREARAGWPTAMPAVVESQPQPIARMVPTLDLKASDCRFPIGDPRDPGFGYCGTPKWERSGAYCEYHHRLCYRPPETRDHRKKPVDYSLVRGVGGQAVEVACR